MEKGKVTVKQRTQTGKGAARRLRSEGLVPGVCYGATMKEPMPVIVNVKELKASLDPIKRTNSVLEVSIEGENSQTVTAMVRDFQIDHIRQEVTHVDFVAVDTNKHLVTTVPVETSGKAKGTTLGGVLKLAAKEVKISVKPLEIPNKFVIDITNLDIGEAIKVGDIDLPEGVSLVTSPHQSLILCEASRASAAVATEAAAAAAAAG